MPNHQRRNSSVRIPHGRKRLITVGALAITLVAAGGSWAGANTGVEGPWTATWGATPAGDAFPFFETGPSFANQTIRQIVRISAGGNRIRIRFTNEFGTQGITIGAAHVGISAGGAAVKSGTDRVVTFSGQPSIAVQTGDPVLSDPIDLEVGALETLAISLYLPTNTGPSTFHPDGHQTTYIMSGDTSGALNPVPTTTASSRYFLSGVDVSLNDNQSTGTIVALGDSITDGTGSTPDTNRRWPDFLAERVSVSPGRSVGVVNQGLAASRLVFDLSGPSGLKRFDRDVLATPGVRFLIVLIGTNDIGSTSPLLGIPSAQDVINGYRQLIARAHSSGIKIFGGTLIPIPPGSPDAEAKRQIINEFIRTSGEFDAVIDFDALIRNPAMPTMMLPQYDSGDHLHPGDAGLKAMADFIDLNLFTLNQGN